MSQSAQQESRPSGWVWDSLSEVMDFQGGAQPPKSSFRYDFAPGYIRFIQIRDFESDDHPTYIKDTPNWRKCVASDVLIARYGASVGRILRGLTGAYNVALAKVEPKASNLDWLYHLLRSPLVQGEILNRSGRTAQAGFNKQDFASITVPIPPLPIQNKIASILSAYDDLIENNNRRIKILEEIAQNIYREWFVHFRYPGHEDVPMVDSELGQIPQGWEVKNINSLIDYDPGSQPPKLTHVYEPTEGYTRFIQNRDYDGSNAHLTFIPDSPKNKTCNEYDIMIDKYGEAGRVRFGLSGAYNVALAKLSPTHENTREYIRGYLAQERIRKYLEQSSGASTRASLNEDHFNFLLVTPDLQTMESWERISRDLISWVLSVRHSNQNLRKTRDLLLPKLISGQLGVEELDIAV